MNALRQLCRATCRPALVAAGIAASAVGPVSHAVTVKNLSSNTTVFADNFEGGLATLTPSVGIWTRIGPSVGAINATAAPAPGPAEGSFYAALYRDSNLNSQGNLDGMLVAAQTVAGDVVRLSAMVHVPDDGVNVRLQFLLTGGDLDTTRAWVRPDGQGNVIAVGPGFALTDTGLDYTPGTWQRWDLTYEIGSAIFGVSVGGVSATGFSSFTAGQVGALSLFNGSTVPGAVYLDAVPVPEPATWALMLAGVGLVSSLTLRRGQAKRGDRP